MRPEHRISDKWLSSAYPRFFDLAYSGESKEQTLDLWLPDMPGAGPYPVVVYCHGGAFREGAKREDISECALRALERGFAVADVEYRKSGEARYPAMLHDAKAAVRYLRAHGKAYDLDVDRFAAWGGSSGAWLVSMLGLTAGMPEFDREDRVYPEYSDAVQAVIDWCGPCGNFARMNSDFVQSGLGNLDHSSADSPEGRFMGGNLDDLPELCRQSAPLTHVHAGMPPFLIVHGALDPVVPIQQSQRFCASIVAAAGADRVEFHALEGVYHHSTDWNDHPVIMKVTMDFLDRVLKR